MTYTDTCNGYTNHDTFMAAVIIDNDLTVYSGLDDIHSPDDLARWVAASSTETNIYYSNVNWQELYDRLLEDRAETQRADAKSRDCTNGNHSVCSSCSCSCHKPSPQKDYSGACADGDHDACKMIPGTGSDECACPHHGKTSTRRTAHGPYGKTWDIVGYMYQADLYTPEGVIEAMIADGLASPAARDMPVEDALDQIAEANAIDRMIEYSFDSDEFPKAVFRDQDEGSYYLDANGDYVTLHRGDEWAVVGVEVAS